MRENILTQLTQLCLLLVCVDPDTKPPRACSQVDRRDRDGSGRWRELRDCWAESFCLRGKMTEQSTKLKLFVAFVKLNVAITEAARLEVITLMQAPDRKQSQVRWSPTHTPRLL